tara:strand:+ start:18632 stop:19537 length:906 start_codon:yes stop_codon:yes gene_type:complete
MYLQRTIRNKIRVEGTGLHTGKPASLVFCPAPENSGVHFVRRDLEGSPYVSPKAQFVQATNMATTLGGKYFSVSTVEHCLSAVAALRIDNLIIELEGPEIPIGDGSAKVFFDALVESGILEQEQPRKYIRITRPVYFGDGQKHAYIVPYNGLRITCEIFFDHPAIGGQKIDIDVNQNSFGKELAGARTFGFMKDVEALQKAGLALGGSLDNAVVLDEEKVLNESGLRWPDEFVRHKALDAVGDLVNLGNPLLGHVVLFRAGHEVMNQLIQKLQDSPDSYQIMELGGDLPPIWRESRHAWLR